MDYGPFLAELFDADGESLVWIIQHAFRPDEKGKNHRQGWGPAFRGRSLDRGVACSATAVSSGESCRGGGARLRAPVPPTKLRVPLLLTRSSTPFAPLSLHHPPTPKRPSIAGWTGLQQDYIHHAYRKKEPRTAARFNAAARQGRFVKITASRSAAAMVNRIACVCACM